MFDRTLNLKIVISAFITSMHSFIFGMNLSIFSTYKEIFINKEKIASFTMNENSFKHAICIICIGALIANIFVSLVRMEKKPLLIINSSVNVLGQLSIRFANNSYYVIFGRFVVGVGAGMTTALVPLYHLQLAPSNLKGVFGSLNQLFCVLGIFFGQIFSFYFDKEGNWMTGLNSICIFVFIHLVCTFFIIKIEEEVNLTENKSVFDLLNNPNSKKSVYTATLILVGQQISGIKSIIFYSEELFSKTNNPKLYKSFLGLSLIIGTFVSMFIIERFGRKKLLMVSCILASLNLLLLAFNKFIFLAIFGFIIGYSIGLGPIPWFIAGELYPKEYKKSGTVVGIAANWLTNYTLALNFPFLLSHSPKYAFIPLFVALTGLVIYIYFFFPETKDRKPGFL